MVRVFLYEFFTGGGLYQRSGRGLPVDSMVREGAAMITALAEDFGRLPDVETVGLRDRRSQTFALPCHQVLPVGSHDEEKARLADLASRCDWTILIAPEFDGLLLERCRLVEHCEGRLLSPGSDVVAWTMDKDATCRRLQSAGIRVPRATRLHRHQTPPADFAFPAVLKPPCGAGSLGVQRVDSARDLSTADFTVDAMRLEALQPGIAASVSLVGGPTGYVLLPPCRQLLSGDASFEYVGGELLSQENLRDRAAILAGRTASTLAGVVGYVGIDMVLGHDPRGAEDCVVEVNPRLTTSYVGLRAAVRVNLAKLMLDVARGKNEAITEEPRPVKFDAHGRVWVAP